MIEQENKIDLNENIKFLLKSGGVGIYAIVVEEKLEKVLFEEEFLKKYSYKNLKLTSVEDIERFSNSVGSMFHIDFINIEAFSYMLDNNISLIQSLNRERDRIFKGLKCPVFLWLNERSREDFLNKAPDFWDFVNEVYQKNYTSRSNNINSDYVQKKISIRNTRKELNIKESLQNELPKKYFLKSFIDLFLAIACLPVVLILFPFIFFGIKISSRGPVFFKQLRTGQLGKEFYCYKFRTMHIFPTRDDNYRPAIIAKRDVRIFRFGSLLRKTNLDELPQIINILKREMSFVGPRPYAIDEDSYWNSKFSDFYKRYLVLPGLSGLAQVEGYLGGTLDEMHMRRRLDYDLIYTQRQSFFLDISLILKTILKQIGFFKKAH